MPASLQAGRNTVRGLHHARSLFGLPKDGNDGHLDRRKFRRNDDAVVVAVSHDQRADHARRKSPARGINELASSLLRLERNVESFREILAQMMRRSRLKRLAVAHHGFDGIRMIGARKLLAFGLAAFDHRQRHVVLGEGLVDPQHPQRFFFRLFIGRVRGVTFLPKELRGAQKQSRSHFPANDVRPLIDQKRQIAIRLNPVAISIPDNGFGSGPDDQRLFQLLTAGMGNDSDFRSETFDVLRLLLKETFRNEHRESRHSGAPFP